jgi:hypothetical protein
MGSTLWETFRSDLPDYEEVSEFVVQYRCRTNTQVSEAHAGSARLFVPHQVALRNYAQGRRNGLSISSALAESAMSHLVNERMGKRQPMRWSAEGAHLLLQVRCDVLDHRLEMLFREWLPKFRRQTPPPLIECCPQL